MIDRRRWPRTTPGSGEHHRPAASGPQSAIGSASCVTKYALLYYRVPDRAVPSASGRLPCLAAASIMSNRFAATLLAIHLLYLLLLPSLSGKAVALAGSVVTLALIVFLRPSPAAADDEFVPRDRSRSGLVLAVFALHLVSLLGQ